MGFFDLLETRVEKVNSLICCGLDPHEVDISNFRTKKNLADDVSDAQVAKAFCEYLIEETKDVVAAYKPNAAFFEALGSEGVDVLKQVIESIPKDIPVVLDCKRGDISSTAEAYAKSSYDFFKAHCVTLSPYMGFDSIEPFVKENRGGAFVLCKTSNPSSKDLETLKLKDEDMMLYEKVAKLCTKWDDNKKNIGVVVGATDVEALKNVRQAAPEIWILAPGVGFQGGNLKEATDCGLRADGLGLLVPVSRGIGRAENPKLAAEELRDQLNQVRCNKKQQTEKEGALAEHQKGFFELALKCGVLKFGEFTLKSGRKSPYFFNAGLFNTGSALSGLGEYYAQAIVDSGIEFDVIFGPAYKGIPLGAVIAYALYSKHGLDVPFAYNRKEKKDHGEGGVLVGASVSGKKVLVVDDVITAGTAIRESISILGKENGTVAGVVIALDRQEKANDTTNQSAIQAVKAEFGFDVVGIVGLDDLLTYLGTTQLQFDSSVLQAVQDYRNKYGVEK